MAGIALPLVHWSGGTMMTWYLCLVIGQVEQGWRLVGPGPVIGPLVRWNNDDRVGLAIGQTEQGWWG